MGFSNASGLNVNNYYGARDTGGSIGIEDADGSVYTLSIQFTGNSLNGTYLPPVVVPKGALLRRAILHIDEAFTLGGTSPTVQFGAAGSVATNGIVLTQAELQAVGTKVPASSGAGTWATNSSTGTTAAAKVGQALGGTSPTVTAGVGKGVLVLEFTNKNKS
jgi:hypothetical protein